MSDAAGIGTSSEEPQAAPMPRGRTILRGVLGMIVGLAVAGLAAWFLGVSPREVAKNLAGVPLWGVAACAASSFVVIAFQALRWHSVMGPVLGLRYGQAYRAQAVGMMFNALIPARGGDLLRVQYLGRRTGKSRAAILGTEIVDRWLDWWGWIPVILILALVDDLPRWVFLGLGMFTAALVSWAVGMLVLTRRGYTPKPGSRWGGVYQSLQSGIVAFRARRTWFSAFFIAPLPWLWEAFVVSRAAPMFDIHITMTQAFCVLVGFNVAMVIPSPGAVGTVEAGGTMALMYFGADKSKAIAFMFVYHFAQLLPGIFMGAAILAAEGEQLFGGPMPAAAAAPAENAAAPPES
ncbi:MAG: lysylphosphatidylglycerol synthase transmembrane domain-containing protein [Minicystis sp.]